MFVQSLKLFSPKLDIYMKPLYHARCQKCGRVQQLNYSRQFFPLSRSPVCSMGKCRNCPGQISLRRAILTRIFRDVWHGGTYPPLKQQNPIHARHSPSLTDKLLCHNGRGNLSQTVQIHGKVATSLSNRVAEVARPPVAASTGAPAYALLSRNQFWRELRAIGCTIFSY